MLRWLGLYALLGALLLGHCAETRDAEARELACAVATAKLEPLVIAGPDEVVHPMVIEGARLYVRVERCERWLEP